MKEGLFVLDESCWNIRRFGLLWLRCRGKLRRQQCPREGCVRLRVIIAQPPRMQVGVGIAV
jgi:hypothetical protein